MSVPQINNGVIGGQFSFARNKIVNQNEQYRPYDYLKRTGREMGINWGYEVIGIYKSQEDIDNRNVKQLLSEVPPATLCSRIRTATVLSTLTTRYLSATARCVRRYTTRSTSVPSGRV